MAYIKIGPLTEEERQADVLSGRVNLVQQKYEVTPENVRVETDNGEIYLYVYNVAPETFRQAKAEAKAEAKAAKARLVELNNALGALTREVAEASRYAAQKESEATRKFGA